jgi:hypothetical protein
MQCAFFDELHHTIIANNDRLSRFILQQKIRLYAIPQCIGSLKVIGGRNVFFVLKKISQKKYRMYKIIE